jgi:hypothetical protein
MGTIMPNMGIKKKTRVSKHQKQVGRATQGVPHWYGGRPLSEKPKELTNLARIDFNAT